MNILFGQLDSVPRIAAEGVLNGIWQGAVLAFLIYLLLRLFKRANATTKYSVWLVTLLAIICLPFLNMLASLRATTTNEPALADNRPLEISGPIPITPQEPSRLSAIAPADAQRPTSTFDSNKTVTASVVALGSNKLSRLEMPLESRRLQESFSIRLSGEGWPRVFLILWALGVAIMIARLIRSYLSLQRLKASSQLLDENYQRRMSHWLKTCGVKRKVQLRGSQEITVPLMLGLRQTVILFPERLANDLAEDEFDQVLLHELAHVRRRDDWSNLAQKFIEAVFFFHPVVLWIARQLNAEREIACDQWVISMTGARRSYASCLARIFELTRAHRSPLLAPGAVAVKSHLSRRIETILKSKRNANTHLSTVGFIIPFCLLLVMVIQLSRLSPIIAVSVRSNSKVETARQNKLAETSALEQSPLNETGWVTDLTSAMEDRGGVSLPGDSEAVAEVSSESSVLNEALRLSAPDGEMTQQNAWIQMVESSGNISGTMQPIAFLSSASNLRVEIPDNLPQSATNSSPPVQEQTASPVTLSNGDTSLPSDFFKAVAALNNSAAQREALVLLLKRRGLTKENLIQSLVVAKGIDSDGEKAEFLENAAVACTGDVAVLNAFFNAVSSLKSAGEQRRVLIALLKSKGRDKGILNRILKAAAAVDSDGEKAELLERAAGLYAIDNATLSAFLSVVSSINSSGERRRALTALLRQNNLSNEIIIQTVRFARNISSDGEKAEFLEKVAVLCPVSDGGVLSAYMETAASINSSQEQARALLAISKKKGIS